MAVRPGDGVNPAQAAVWGLVRSAQSGHPGRFVLVDVDHYEASLRVLPNALSSGEPQITVRERRSACSPARARMNAVPGQSAGWDPEDTVMITGGTGVLGRLPARHLVAVHGVRHLVLASRRGPAAEGVQDLLSELAEGGQRSRRSLAT